MVRQIPRYSKSYQQNSKQLQADRPCLQLSRNILQPIRFHCPVKRRAPLTLNLGRHMSCEVNLLLIDRQVILPFPWHQFACQVTCLFHSRTPVAGVLTVQELHQVGPFTGKTQEDANYLSG